MLELRTFCISSRLAAVAGTFNREEIAKRKQKTLDLEIVAFIHLNLCLANYSIIIRSVDISLFGLYPKTRN